MHPNILLIVTVKCLKSLTEMNRSQEKFEESQSHRHYRSCR